jgi:sulfur carrier protein
MKVTVELHPPREARRTLELPERATVEDALRSLGNLPDAWIALRGNRPIPMDTPLEEGDHLRFVAVASGG